MRFYFLVALRHVVTRLRATLTILIGVGIGVFVMTVMQSMMFGFQGQFMDTLLTITPGILVKGKPRCTVHIHPDDALRLGIDDCADVRVRSSSGEIVLPAHVTDEVRPGVVSIPHGWGHDLDGMQCETARKNAGANSNVLARGDLFDPLSGNAVLNGIPVELAPAI